MSIESLTVVLYQEANRPAIAFEVPLLDGWFIFAHNLTFYQRTGYPGVELTIYDTETGEFIPLLTAGGLLVDDVLHPWIVICAHELQHNECPNLAECIGSLLETRDEARAIVNGVLTHGANANGGSTVVGDADVGVGNGGNMDGGVSIEGAASVGVGNEDTVGSEGAVGRSTDIDDMLDDGVDSDDDIEPPSCSQFPVIVVDDDLEDYEAVPSGSQYGVIVVDDDVEDTDYVDSEEEEEAVETGDEAEKRRVIIDLTYMSD